MEQSGKHLTEVLAPYKDERGAIIPLLQKVQETFGYLSEEAISQIAKFFKVSESEVFGVATFYAQFRFTRPAEHCVKVCLGTACHVRGGQQILEAVRRDLGLESGSTTTDYKFGVERVACFGSCALAPVMVVDDRVYGRLTPTKIKETLDKYR
ncbi:MAG: NADH-quinone oxidoreductase subunit NuoE [Chloroflexi bacterium]|nr:NADH-quinone oxidoreductase subunit NuoE [Chloroflexota bacterium]